MTETMPTNSSIKNESAWAEKINKFKELLEKKRFALNASDKTREISGKVWFKHPLGQKMDGMFFVDSDGNVFELDFKKEDFLGSMTEENKFFDEMQRLVKDAGFELCALNNDLQKASSIEDDIEKAH